MLEGEHYREDEKAQNTREIRLALANILKKEKAEKIHLLVDRSNRASWWLIGTVIGVKIPGEKNTLSH